MAADEVRESCSQAEEPFLQHGHRQEEGKQMCFLAAALGIVRGVGGAGRKSLHKTGSVCYQRKA